MKTVFSFINVNYSEYQYFLTLSNSEKLNYLFDVYETEVQRQSGIDLGTFFDSVRKTIIEINSQDSELEISETYEVDGFGDNAERVDIMIDNENIMIESNSLKALRHITYKFIESGYIIQRDVNLEKMFRKDKITRYLRIFRIINQATNLCAN